jgi:hypothetical protein
LTANTDKKGKEYFKDPMDSFWLFHNFLRVFPFGAPRRGAMKKYPTERRVKEKCKLRNCGHAS